MIGAETLKCGERESGARTEHLVILEIPPIQTILRYRNLDITRRAIFDD